MILQWTDPDASVEIKKATFYSPARIEQVWSSNCGNLFHMIKTWFSLENVNKLIKCSIGIFNVPSSPLSRWLFPRSCLWERERDRKTDRQTHRIEEKYGVPLLPSWQNPRWIHLQHKRHPIQNVPAKPSSQIYYPNTCAMPSFHLWRYNDVDFRKKIKSFL